MIDSLKTVFEDSKYSLCKGINSDLSLISNQVFDEELDRLESYENE